MFVTEIVEDEASAACVGLAVASHRVEAGERGVLCLGAVLRIVERVAGAVGETAFPVQKVASGPEHDAARGLPVASRAAGLLVERFDAFAWPVVEDHRTSGLSTPMPNAVVAQITRGDPVRNPSWMRAFSLSDSGA